MKKLEDYTDEFKIGWFNELYQAALDCSNDPVKENIDIYKTMFFNAAMDLLNEKKEFRIYELRGVTIINAYSTSRVELEMQNETSQS